MLRLYARLHNPKGAVVVLNERPTPLRAETRPDEPTGPGREKRRDFEYVRKGVANIFCIVDPKGGRHPTYASKNRKKPAFVAAINKIARAYPNARRIHVVMDNLNTHRIKWLLDVLGDKEGKKLAKRFEFHFTPKNASWLNIAEIEASLASLECLGKARIATLPILPMSQCWLEMFSC